MTTKDEERNAVVFAGDFLMSLLDPKLTPGVPRAVREEARARLRHFPMTGLGWSWSAERGWFVKEDA